MALGLSRFSARIFTKSLSDLEFGSGNGIGSEGEVRTKAEKTTATAITAIWIFLSTEQ